MPRRDEVRTLAKQDPAAALKLAQSINETREHIQSLGWVLRYAPQQIVPKLVELAVAASNEATDAYTGTMSLAWPIRAVLENSPGEKKNRGKNNYQTHLTVLVKAALDLVPCVTPNSSRAQALILLLHAALPAGSRVVEPIVQRLTATADDHWRVSRAMVDGALLLNAIDRSQALRIAGTIATLPKQRATLKRLESGETLEPRPFYW